MNEDNIDRTVRFGRGCGEAPTRRVPATVILISLRPMRPSVLLVCVNVSSLLCQQIAIKWKLFLFILQRNFYYFLACAAISQVFKTSLLQGFIAVPIYPGV